MVRRLGFVLSFTALLTFGQDKPELTVDQIVENHVQALGGLERIRAIHSFSATGKASMMDGQVQAPMVMQMKRPSCMRIEMLLQDKRIVQAFDGSTAWRINPASGSDAPKRATPDETEELKASADLDFSSLVDYRSKGNEVELAGLEDVNGQLAYRFKVTRQNGRIQYDFLDKKTFLSVKTATKRKLNGAEVEIDAYPSDFRRVDGVLFPYHVDQKADGKLVLQLTLETVAVNIDLGDALFRIPEKPLQKREAGKNF